MAFNKAEIMNLSAEEKRKLAFELLDSIDEQIIQQGLPAWKKEIIQQRIARDKTANIEDAIAWETLRNKYKH